jgi:hypothetical protein
MGFRFRVVQLHRQFGQSLEMGFRFRVVQLHMQSCGIGNRFIKAVTCQSSTGNMLT